MSILAGTSQAIVVSPGPSGRCGPSTNPGGPVMVCLTYDDFSRTEIGTWGPSSAGPIWTQTGGASSIGVTPGAGVINPYSTSPGTLTSASIAGQHSSIWTDDNGFYATIRMKFSDIGVAGGSTNDFDFSIDGSGDRIHVEIAPKATGFIRVYNDNANYDQSFDISDWVLGFWYTIYWHHQPGVVTQAKVWPDGQAEPTGWQVSAVPPSAVSTDPASTLHLFAAGGLSPNVEPGPLYSFQSIVFCYTPPVLPPCPMPYADTFNRTVTGSLGGNWIVDNTGIPTFHTTFPNPNVVPSYATWAMTTNHTTPTHAVSQFYLTTGNVEAFDGETLITARAYLSAYCGDSAGNGGFAILDMTPRVGGGAFLRIVWGGDTGGHYVELQGDDGAGTPFDVTPFPYGSGSVPVGWFNVKILFTAATFSVKVWSDAIGEPGSYQFVGAGAAATGAPYSYQSKWDIIPGSQVDYNPEVRFTSFLAIGQNCTP